MGGCATKPKEIDGNPPAEDPNAPELLAKSLDVNAALAPEEAKAEAADVAAEKDAKEEPLVDLSEPKPESPVEKEGEPDNAGLTVEDSGETKEDAPKPTPVETAPEEKKEGPAETSANEVPGDADGAGAPEQKATEETRKDGAAKGDAAQVQEEVKVVAPTERGAEA